MIESVTIYFIMLLVTIIVAGMIYTNNLIILALLSSSFSLFTLVLYLLLTAPDVAMTEACVSILSFVFAILAIRYTKAKEFIEKFNPWIFLSVSLLAVILIYAGQDLPEFGAPKFNHYYLQNSVEETDMLSAVAAILASYRGFDTLLETLVIVVAAMAVLLVSAQENYLPVNNDLLIRTMTRITLPLILLFAFYIQFHGEISPGGGFQAGAIIATGLMIYAMVYGGKNLQAKLISQNTLKYLSLTGVMIYIMAGFVGIFAGLEFLNYDLFFSQAIWVMLVELAICVSVAAAMLLIYLRLSYVV